MIVWDSQKSNIKCWKFLRMPGSVYGISPPPSPPPPPPPHTPNTCLPHPPHTIPPPEPQPRLTNGDEWPSINTINNTIRPLTSETRPALERRKTLGHLRSINRNMIIHFANQSQTCQLSKILKNFFFSNFSWKETVKSGAINPRLKIHIDYQERHKYIYICRVLGITF